MSFILANVTAFAAMVVVFPTEVTSPFMLALVVTVDALPPILKLVTGVVDVTTNGAVPVATVDVIVPVVDNEIPDIVPVAVTEDGVIAPRVKVIAGVVEGFVIDPLTPFAVTTDAEVTVPVAGITQLNEPAVEPAVRTLPLLVVLVAGMCKLPSPVG
jgi:hypothetical protein